MKKSGSILFILFVCNICMAQKPKSNGQPAQVLGQYWFVMYNKTQKSSIDSAARTKLMAEHISYILSLRKAAKIINGGAFTDQGSWLGFQIYNCKTKEEVIKLTEEDPLISSKIAAYEVHPWVTLRGVVTFE